MLSLPSTRSGPVPSPRLEHNWTLDWETPSFLAPWIINGLWFAPQDAMQILLDLPTLERRNRGMVAGEDARYWWIATTLVLEAIAEVAPHVRRAEQLAEHVRMRMAQQICGDLSENGVLKVLRLGNRCNGWMEQLFHRRIGIDP